MRLQGLVNRVVRGLLRTPLFCRAIGKALITLYLVGRKSGRRYTVPVAYVSHDGALLFGTPFGWGRNLQTGQSIDIRLKGKRRSADVQVISDEAGVVELYEVMVRANGNFAKFNKIGLDQAGHPNAEDLHAAWAAGAKAFLLTPR
jgi:deazaflavin-dependent oxidoreductase (nitroreductase family)